MKADKVREMSAEELGAKERELSEQLFKLRFQKSIGQLDNALKSYQLAIRLKPQYVEALNNLGTVYYAKKNHRRAISWYQRALKLAPEEPLSTSYRGYEVYKPGFWSQGPAMLEALNILEGFDLRGMHYNSAEYLHTMAEALKLAYADRAMFLGDPASVERRRVYRSFDRGRERAAPGRQIYGDHCIINRQVGRVMLAGLRASR